MATCVPPGQQRPPNQLSSDAGLLIAGLCLYALVSREPRSGRIGLEGRGWESLVNDDGGGDSEEAGDGEREGVEGELPYHDLRLRRRENE